MKKTPPSLLCTLTCGLVAAGLGWTACSQAAPLISFPFNEGSGTNVTDTAQGLQGYFGLRQDAALDTVTLTETAPSGLPGDKCMTTTGNGFLIVDDSSSPILAITNGPITLECWLYIDPFGAPKAAEGLVGYGNSYKMGLKGGRVVFTLFGIRDITNSLDTVGAVLAPPLNVGEWVHVATAWEPGVGVHFYVNGVSNFTAWTTLAARPPLHNYLGLGSEGVGNNIVGSLDRVRIHHALLTGDDLDTVAANPKAPLASTVVAYNFNEADFPCDNAVAPSRPTQLSHEVLGTVAAPTWTNDTPSGLAGDYALAFLNDDLFTKEYITVDYGSTPVNLGENNTNYTLQAWVKLPTDPMEDRRVIYQTAGPAPRIALSIHADRSLHTTIYGNKDFDTPVKIPNDNRWHHVAAVMEDFARMHFYLDGIHRFTTNRTATGVPSASGSGRLLIGKESETRFFRGLLDRVHMHNHALAANELDFPAIPGLATFPTLASHPADTNVNLGDSVMFTAAPSSATPATYQWRYRTKLADHDSVAISGANSTTLQVEDISVDDLGFYSLVVSNEVGVTESYAARLGLIPDLSNKPFDFEPPTYTSGTIEGQDNWVNDYNGGAVSVLTEAEIEAALVATGRTPGQTVHGGSQALMVSGIGLASATIRRVTGLETEQDVTLDVWVRPLSAAAGTSIGNTFLTMENAAGTRAAAFRIGPALSIDYGSTNSGTWVATGLTADPDTWYRLTMKLNYATRYYDFYVNDTKVNTNPIRFYNVNSDGFRQIRIFRGAAQAGMIVDDLNITGPEVPPTLGIRKEGASLIIFWPATVTDYELKSANAVNAAPETWTTVPHTTVGDEHQAVIAPTENSQFFRLVK